MSSDESTPETTSEYSPREEEAKDNVKSVDPNEGRCLVENCHETRAVDFAHCFPRSMNSKRRLMDKIEWFWNMPHNSLNLDTRRNIFRAEAAIHRLFDSNSWLLIPDETTIQTFHDTLKYDDLTERWSADRRLFPNIPDRDKPNYFEYRLIPTSRMKVIALHRQTNVSGAQLTSNDFTTYVYPFADMPLLRSHLHPKFVLLETGRKMKIIADATHHDLRERYPALTKVVQIYEAWIADLPEEALEDASYGYKRKRGNDDNEGDHHEDGRTTSHRLRERKRPRTRHDPNDSPTPAPGQTSQRRHALKREPSISLSKRSLKLHDKESEEKKWTDDAVRDWSKQCPRLPEAVRNPWVPNEICV